MLSGCLLSVSAQAAFAASKSELAYGRYLVKLGGCNDCHTPGYAEAGGKMPESDWLTGNPVGFAGPWGVTYPVNLRHYVHGMSEAEWLKKARMKRRPPMPWFTLAKLKTSDLKAMYRYIHSLGDKGKPAPAYLPPGKPITTPYIDFMPKNLPAPKS